MKPSTPNSIHPSADSPAKNSNASATQQNIVEVRVGNQIKRYQRVVYGRHNKVS